MVLFHPCLPLLLVAAAPLPGLPEVGLGLLGDGKWLLIGPPKLLPGQEDLFLAQRFSVGRGGAGFVGAAVAYDGAADDQAGAGSLRLGHADC